MADISNINLSSYIGKTQNGTVQSAEWNTLFATIQSKFNEIISKLNAGGSSSSDADFYVNGVKTTPVSGVVQLAAKGKYTLSGTLNGRIVIGTAADTWAADEDAPTQVILDGVAITTDSDENSAIDYVPQYDKMLVTLAKNKVNHILCSHEAARTDSQKGCIHCENNLVIQGSGYLTCVNNGGHGIKGSELRLSGNPHIYVEAIHDGIHGNKIVSIDSGIYYINKANDAFGTRAADPSAGKTAGSINIFGGEFFAYNIVQNVFDSKAQGYIFRPVSVQTDCTSIYLGISSIDPKVYFGNAVQDNTNGGYTTQPSGSVQCYTDGSLSMGMTEIQPVDGIYTLTTKYAKVSGYVTGKVVANTESTDITLNNAYVEGSIEYIKTKKKLQVNVESNGIGIIAGDLMSSSNLAVEVKNGGHFVLEGDLVGDELTFTDSKGVALIAGDVIGKDIYIGTAATPDATKKLWGGLIVYGTMTANFNSKFKKGDIHILDAGLVGTFTANTINVKGTADMKSANSFYLSAIGTTLGSKTYEPADYLTPSSPFPLPPNL